MVKSLRQTSIDLVTQALISRARARPALAKRAAENLVSVAEEFSIPIEPDLFEWIELAESWTAAEFRRWAELRAKHRQEDNDATEERLDLFEHCKAFGLELKVGKKSRDWPD